MVETIYSGSGSFTIPAGSESLEIEIWGSGGGYDDIDMGGCGQYVKKIPIIQGPPISYTIGAGGKGGAGMVSFSFQEKKPSEVRKIDDDFQVSYEPKWV